MKKYATLIVCLAVICQGCSSYYYTPNKANVPNLREQGDLRLDAGAGGGWVMKGVDVQTAYAVSSHLGLMVNGALTSSNGSSTNYSEHEYTKTGYAEAGLGYFTQLEENNHWVFEAFGGAGIGDYDVHYAVEKRAKLNMRKYFLQPSVSYTHPRKNIELSIGSRFAGVDYNRNGLPYLDPTEFSRITNLANRSMQLYWEPSFRFSAGSKNFKGFVSYTPSISILETNIPREYFNINLGMRFTLNLAGRD